MKKPWHYTWRTLWTHWTRWLGAVPAAVTRSRPAAPMQPSVDRESLRWIPQAQHGIPRSAIPESVARVLTRLQRSGYQAYLVGGGVRDLLLGVSPKDFDVATDARPEQVRSLFRNSRIIGRRFRLVHVLFHQQCIEVATFRKGHAEDAADPSVARVSAGGLIERDNVYGTLEEDADRRDCTINALYYNFADQTVWDQSGGLEDLRLRHLRIIGCPSQRYQEDPVRIIRVFRIAAKLGFAIDPETLAPIAERVGLLASVSESRLFDELLKIVHSGAATQAFAWCAEYGIFQVLFPALQAHWDADPLGWSWITHLTQRVDAETQEADVTFFFAAFFWRFLAEKVPALQGTGTPGLQAVEQEGRLLLETGMYLIIPRRIRENILALWLLQVRFVRYRSRADRCMQDPMFKSAIAFLRLRSVLEPTCVSVLAWWESYAAADLATRRRLILALSRRTRQSR